MDLEDKLIFITACSSFSLFYLFDLFLLVIGPPRKIQNCFSIMEKYRSKTRDDVIRLQFWRLRNMALSVIHANVSGSAMLLCFYWHPGLMDDSKRYFSLFALLIIAFSVGYFIHDTYHMVVGNLSKGSVEIIIHHVIGVFCLMVVLNIRLYLGYCLAGLMVEVNSVFLHARQILRIFHVKERSLLYVIVGILNISTFVVFRLMVLVWQFYWGYYHWHEMAFPIKCLLSFCIPSMGLMNVILFYRLVSADFSYWFKTTLKPTITENSNHHHVPDKNGFQINGINSDVADHKLT